MNKTVKNVLIICVCVVLIAGVAGAIWFWDTTRVIESPYPEILAINTDVHGFRAYSINKSKDTLIITQYTNTSLVKVVHTSELDNNIVVSYTTEAHYSTKYEASTFAKVQENKKAKGNILYTINPNTEFIGKTADEVISLCEAGWAHAKKINEIK